MKVALLLSQTHTQTRTQPKPIEKYRSNEKQLKAPNETSLFLFYEIYIVARK